MLDNQYDSILEAVSSAAEKQYHNSFIAVSAGLKCLETGEIFNAGQITIDAFHRIEGATNPGESAVVYLVRTFNGVKGTLVDAYGTYASADVASVISKIPIARQETAGRFDNKQCLNCSTILQGEFCHVCGQKDENLHEPFYVMLAHGVAHYWHFDSKLFKTFGPLLVKPGFLSKEFMEGRRVRYVHPVQLYIFISIVFFLLFASVAANRLGNALENTNTPEKESVDGMMDSLRMTEMNQRDSNSFEMDVKTLRGINGRVQVMDQDSNLIDHAKDSAATGQNESSFLVTNNILPRSIDKYNDSIEVLAKEQKPSEVQQGFDRLAIHLNAMDRKELIERFAENLSHNLPKLMFLLIPVFALILKLIFIRKRIYFVDHAVFTLHFHSFAFLIMLILLLLFFITGFTVPLFWLLALLIVYLFLAIRFFYGLSILDALFKLISLTALYLFTAMVSTVLYLIVVLFTI